MPKWIHERAEHLLAKNPSMSKSMAFGVATQQSHATGKTPKKYGTTEGKREARAKYDAPKKEYTKTPNPGDLETPKLSDKPKTRWTGTRLVKKAMYDAMKDELLHILKEARIGVSPGEAAVLGAAVPLVLGGASYAALGESGRKRMGREVRDPRLYSNLRGMGTLESGKERVAAHKKLKRGKHHTVLSAMKEGFTRGGGREKSAYAALTPAGRLRLRQSVGRAPGSFENNTPSIADQVKPKGKGFGGPLPGVNQGGAS
jgi:hypothetical protein